MNFKKIADRSFKYKRKSMSLSNNLKKRQRSTNISESSGSKLFSTTAQISDAIEACHHKRISTELSLR